MPSKTETTSPQERKRRLEEATEALTELHLGTEREQAITAYTLLALLDLSPHAPWSEAQAPLRSIPEIIEFIADVYAEHYSPNARETIRNEGLKALVQMGLVLQNPDAPDRPSNSSKTVYQIEPHALSLLRNFGASGWTAALQEYLARDSKPLDPDGRPSGDRAEAFILYNEAEKGIETIVNEFQKRNVSTYYWRRDVPLGSQWEEIESQQLREALTVIVFLGEQGWGPNHLRITQEALSLGKRIIPILVGMPSDADLDKANGLFRKNRYLELQTVTMDALDLLVKEIRRPVTLDQGRVITPQFDKILRVLIDGNEEQRSDALSQIRNLQLAQRSSLAERLCTEIEGRFSPQSEGEFASAIRDPKKFSSIRSWMLSSLIWADPEGTRGRNCIIRHLREDTEPDRNVRFWALAGLYQRSVSYLNDAVKICNADSKPEVAALSKAITFHDDQNLHNEFRALLNSSKFETTWQVLRLLRVVPIPELAGDVCALLKRSNEGVPLAYDALYALTHPEMAREAARILTEGMGVEEVVLRVIAELKNANENAGRHFAVLLVEFDTAQVDLAIQHAQNLPENRDTAQSLREFVQDYRRRRAEPREKDIPSDYSYGPAGYTSEFCGVGGNRPVADHLGVEALAHRLAELIALRETRLPLAIGLFGNWGSGKSHFMNLIDRKLKMLANETPEDWARRVARPGAPARLDLTGEGPWCREIVPIYFNAWHYLDTNLWASLVTEIFDGLSAHLEPKQDELALMRSRLRDAGGATARAEEEAVNAHEAVRKASVALQEARAHSEGARQAVRGLMDNLRTLLPQVNTPENQKRIVEWLGVSAEVATLSQLAEKHREMVSLPGQFRELWHRATAREGLSGRLGWLFGALIVAPALAWLGAALMPQIAAWLKSTGPGLKTALTALIGAVSWMIPVFAQVRHRLRQMETWQKQAEEAQAAMPKEKQVIDAQEKVVQTEAAAVTAVAGLAAARALEHQLTKEVDELRPERRLGRFIEARARSADYRGQLGLVSLARKDFQELSDIFADAEALQEKVDKLSPSEGEQLRRLGASIDRIVLFVDDLDRCQPEKVADVLEAVHLLLAYPLFAVVVGVDQRCLKQSIRKQFRGLMSHRDDPENGERNATPLDYLEKIFHVPFHLPPMGETGFATLIQKLTEPPMAAPNRVAPAENNEAELRTELPDAKPKSDQERLETTQFLFPQSTSPSEDPTTAPGGTSRGDESINTSTQTIQVIGSVPLQAWEREALKDYHPLLCTPRGATRLLNTYRLVRAGIPANEWDSFRGDGITDGEFRVAMLLLASAAGYPAVAREWFGTLRSANSTALFVSDDSGKNAAGSWIQFKKVYDATFAQTTPLPTKELFAKWLDRVERFAF